METLRSPLYEVADAFEANELFQRNGWTDGLPIVPPTETLVRAIPGGGRPGARRRRRHRAGAPPADHRREGGHRRGDGRLPARILAGRAWRACGRCASRSSACTASRPAPGAARRSSWSTVRSGWRLGMNATHNVARQRQPGQRHDRPGAAAAHHQRAGRYPGSARPLDARASRQVHASAWPRTRRTARGCRWPPSAGCRRAPRRSPCWRSSRRTRS